MIQKDIIYFGKQCTLACDAKCEKAWGINNRPSEKLSETDDDDYAFLADDELGEAPANPGTYEGSEAKPIYEDERLNRWCARECERSTIAEPNEAIVLTDFSRRVYNMPSKHEN